MKRHAGRRFLPLAGACLGVIFFLASPGTARAVDFGVRGGVYSEEDSPFVGAEALIDLDQTGRWYGNPNLEHVFQDTADITSVSFDFHYDFPSGNPYTVWVGAGPTLIHADRDIPEVPNGNDAGLNVVVGVGAKKGNVRPYGQLKAIVADDNQLVFGVGARF
jgi:hypothetical protein